MFMIEQHIETPKAKCAYCGNLYSKGGMSRHLKSCKARQAAIADEKTQEKIFHLRVEGAALYWMHIEIAGNQPLSTLDTFLREIWLECCGHLSDFSIAGTTYSSHPLDWSKPQKSHLNTVLRDDSVFVHSYDYGSTTELYLKVVEIREGAQIQDGNKVRVLARNEAPAILCEYCNKKPADWYSSELEWEDESPWICDACAEHKEINIEEYALPVVNSPRVGVCGFTGASLT